MTQFTGLGPPLARLLVALTSNAYFEPDAHLQSLETILGNLLSFQGSDGLHTREWASQEPTQSVVWPLLTTIPILLVKLLGGEDRCSFRVLLWVPRIVSWMISEATFLVMGATAQRMGYGKLSPWASLGMVPFTFLLRPSSSTLETLLLVCLFYCVVDIAQFPVGQLANRRFSSASLLLLIGVITSLGLFVRVTFAAFAVAPLQSLVWELWKFRNARQSNRPGSDPLVTALIELIPFS
jgi:hypothetical protein